MAREIKFRAFDDGAMLYSHDDTIDNDYEQTSRFFNIIRPDAIVMQFTGLLDRQGREIYEGDVLQLEKRFFYNDETEQSEKHKDIVFVKAESMLNVKCYYCDGGNKWDNGWSYSEWSDDWHDDLSEVEVIGNIYENPELLNPKKD